MRVCVIAASRHPVRQPFAGGLESFTHGLVSALAARGHDVTLFAGPGTDPALPVRQVRVAAFEPSPAATRDRTMPSRIWLEEHHAYLGLLLELARGEHGADVVHNTSLHHLPVAMAPALPVPLLTTLHTPPLPWVESAIELTGAASHFVSVSRHIAQAWSHAVPSTVVLNGVDLHRWAAGPGGGNAVWSGRIVPEKGVHHAIDACRLAGVPLVIAGPMHDAEYAAAEVLPRLGDDVTYAGHLDDAALAALVGRSRVAVVSPRWDEPYGLVAAEAMATGTPVAAYARGGLPEVLGEDGGVLARADDVEDLAAAITAAARLDRVSVRRAAEQRCSIDAMVDGYEACYRRLVAAPAPGHEVAA